MKTGTFILSFLFVILTVQPMFIKWDKAPCINNSSQVKILPQTGGCCKKNSATKCPLKKQDKQQPVSPCNTCNPFMPCNACGYMPEETGKFISPIILGNADNTIGPDEFTLSSFTADCWHPPELFEHL
ncbi:MAG: hypothetical protein ABIQ07_00830 [Ginsengibacter sp.]